MRRVNSLLFTGIKPTACILRVYVLCSFALIHLIMWYQVIARLCINAHPVYQPFVCNSFLNRIHFRSVCPNLMYGHVSSILRGILCLNVHWNLYVLLTESFRVYVLAITLIAIDYIDKYKSLLCAPCNCFCSAFIYTLCAFFLCPCRVLFCDVLHTQGGPHGPRCTPQCENTRRGKYQNHPQHIHTYSQF